MDTLIDDQIIASEDMLDRWLGKLIGECNISYLLEGYIDKAYWMEDIEKYFSIECLENNTDFNYSRCFSYSLNEGFEALSDALYGLEFGGEIYRTEISISLLAPFLFYRYLKYELIDGKVEVSSELRPFTSLQSKFDSRISGFCKDKKLLIVPDVSLERKIKGLSLELHGEGASAYNLFFEDGASRFPYMVDGKH